MSGKNKKIAKSLPDIRAMEKSRFTGAFVTHIELLENITFGIIVFALVAAFSTKLQEHFTLPKLLGLRIGGVVLCLILLFHVCSGKLPRMLPRTIVVSGCLLVLWWVVTTFFSVHLPTALNGFQGRNNGLLNQLLYVFVFFSFALSALDRKRIERFMSILTVTFVPVAIYAILQHYKLDPYQWPMDRPAATMGNPVLLAATLGLVMPYCLYETISNQQLARRVLAGIFLILFSFTVILTMSRGPWIGISLAMFSMVIEAVRQGVLSWKVIVKSVSAIICLIILLYASDASLRSASTARIDALIKSASDSSVKMRFIYYEAAKEMVQERPLFGAGFETYRILYSKYRSAKDPSPQIIPTMVHNTYIERAVSNGIPGLLLYLIFIGTILIHLTKSAIAVEDDSRTKLLLFSFISSIAGFLIQDLSGWQDVALSGFFWMTAGLSVSAAGVTLTEKLKSHYPHTLSNVSKTLIPILSVILCAHLWLVSDAVARVKADYIYRKVEDLNAGTDWNEIKLLVDNAAGISSKNYYYLDKAAQLYMKRFAMTGEPGLYSTAQSLYEHSFSLNPYDSYIILHAMTLDSLAMKSGVIQSPSKFIESGLKNILTIDRNNPQLVEPIGRFYAQSRNYSEALKWQAKLQHTGAAGISAFLLEAEIARGMGNTDLALKSLRKAISYLEKSKSYNQQWANTKLVVASIEMEKKQTDLALNETIEVSKYFPSEIKSYLIRGDIFAVKGDLISARNSYKDAMAVEPENQFAKRGFEAAERLLREQR